MQISELIKALEIYSKSDAVNGGRTIKTDATFTGTLSVAIDQSTDSILIFGSDGAANQPIKTDASGNVQVNVLNSADTVIDPATSALQSTGNASLVSIDAGIPAGLGQTTMVNSMPVVLASNQTAIPVSGTIAPLLGTTSSVTSVASNVAVQTLKAANASRISLAIVNDGSDNLYVKKGSGASDTSFTYKLRANDTVDISDYSGIITGIWDVASGSARITEITP